MSTTPRHLVWWLFLQEAAKLVPMQVFHLQHLKRTALWSDHKQHQVEFCSWAVGNVTQGFPLCHCTSSRRDGSSKWKCFCCCSLNMLKYLQINTLIEAEAGPRERWLGYWNHLKNKLSFWKQVLLYKIWTKAAQAMSEMLFGCPLWLQWPCRGPHPTALFGGMKAKFLFLTDVLYLTSILMQRSSLRNLQIILITSLVFWNFNLNYIGLVMLISLECSWWRPCRYFVLSSYVETELFLRFLQTQAQMTSIKSILTIISLYLLFTETNKTGTC